MGPYGSIGGYSMGGSNWEGSGSLAPSGVDYDNYCDSGSKMSFGDWWKWQLGLNFKNSNTGKSGYWLQEGYVDQSGWYIWSYPDGSIRYERANTTVISLRWVSNDGSNLLVNNLGSIARNGVGVGLVYLGDNSIKARGKFLGATEGTSIASKYLSKQFPRQLNRQNPTIWKIVRKTVPKSTFGMPLRSPVLGRMLGRSLPIVGYAFLAWDVIDAAKMAYKISHSFIYDKPEEFAAKNRKYVTTIGLYNDFEDE